MLRGTFFREPPEYQRFNNDFLGCREKLVVTLKLYDGRIKPDNKQWTVTGTIGVRFRADAGIFPLSASPDGSRSPLDHKCNQCKGPLFREWRS
jgi:hypothetical protein